LGTARRSPAGPVSGGEPLEWDVSLLDRVRASALLNRLVPTAAALALARLWALGRWHASVSTRLDALLWAARLLDEDPRAAAVSKLAKSAHVDRSVRAAFAARPWRVRRAGVEGLERLAAITEAGRGAILMFTHTGGYGSFLLALASKDFELHLCRRPIVRVRDAEELIQWKRWGWQADAPGCRLIYPGGSYATLRAVLERGGVCAIAFDVPGRRETTFLGQQMSLASGIASLAIEVGVPVLPAFAIPGEGGEIGRLEAAIEPANFTHVDELHAHLADVASRAIGEYPHLAYLAHGAVHDTHARTPLVRRLERHLAKAEGERAKAQRRAAAAESKRERAEARLRAVQESTWWRLGVAARRLGDIPRAPVGSKRARSVAERRWSQ